MGTTDPFREKLRDVAEQIGAITEYAAGPLAAFIAANRVTVYGHSYTPVPSKYVPAGKEWPNVLASALGVECVSQGVGGSRMIDAARFAVGNTGRKYQAGQAGAVVIECVVNDALSGPSTEAGRKGFTHALRSFLAAATAEKRIEAETAQASGAWANLDGANFSGGTIMRSGESGATLTFNNVEAPAGKAYILTVANRASTTTGAIRVTVDGVDQGVSYTGSGQMEQYTSYVGTGTVADSPAVVEVTIPTTGKHSVKVTNAGGGSVYVDALLVPAATPPPVLVLKDPPIGHLAAQQHQDAWTSNAPALHSILDTVAAEFPTASVVDLGPGWEPATMVSDNDPALLHPGELGMEHIAKRLEQPLVNALMERLAAKMWA